MMIMMTGVGIGVTKNYQKRKEGSSLGYRTPDHFKGKSFKPIKNKLRKLRKKV